MSERYTQKDAEQAFRQLAEAAGKEIVTKGEPFPDRVGKWQLSTEFQYGGHVIQEITNPTLGHTNPFGHTRRNHREFCEFVSATLHGIRIGREQNKGE